MSNTLVAITTYNQADYTKRCFETLKQIPFKVICVDDCSTDRTAKLCADYGIDFLTRDRGMGLTYSWNAAYRYFLDGHYENLIIANNDVLFPKGSIENAVQALKDHVCVSFMTRKNEGGWWVKKLAVEKYFKIKSKDADNPDNFQNIQDEVNRNQIDPVFVNVLSGYCFGVNRFITAYEYAEKTLFDPSNINVGQEKDLLSRLPGSTLCTNAFVYHFKGVSFKGFKPGKSLWWMETRNRLEHFRE